VDDGILNNLSFLFLIFEEVFFYCLHKMIFRFNEKIVKYLMLMISCLILENDDMRYRMNV